MDRFFVVRRALRVVSMLAVAASLCACSRSADGPSEPAAIKEAAHASPRPLLYPAGIVTPPNARIAAKLGLYAAPNRSECCFLKKRATFVLDNPTPTSTVTFKVIVPNVRPFWKSPERITLELNGIPAGAREAIPGQDNLSFSVPPSLRNKAKLRADLSMAIVFVPKRIGYNADTRELSIILISVSYSTKAASSFGKTMRSQRRTD